jgi:hypothetical protein
MSSSTIANAVRRHRLPPLQPSAIIATPPSLPSLATVSRHHFFSPSAILENFHQPLSTDTIFSFLQHTLSPPLIHHSFASCYCQGCLSVAEPCCRHHHLLFAGAADSCLQPSSSSSPISLLSLQLTSACPPFYLKMLIVVL